MRANEKESAEALSSMSRRFYEFCIVTTRKLPLWFNSCTEKLFLHSQCSPAAPPITRRYVFVVPKSFSMSWFGIWYFPFGFLNTSLWLSIHSHSHFTSACVERTIVNSIPITNLLNIFQAIGLHVSHVDVRKPKIRFMCGNWRYTRIAHPPSFSRCRVTQIASVFSSKKWKVRLRFHFTYSLTVGWLSCFCSRSRAILWLSRKGEQKARKQWIKSSLSLRTQ